MATYASNSDIEDRLGRTLADTEEVTCQSLIEEAAVIIDGINSDASDDAKRLVSIRMVSRALGCSNDGVPLGATQGSMSALGYSQSWTMSGGSTGELYISKIERQMLGQKLRIGFTSPLEDLVND
jgi:hypothetical protein